MWFAPPAADGDGSFSTIDAAESAPRSAAAAAVDVERVVDARIATLAELPAAIQLAQRRARAAA